jgi:hypothetical protein
MGLLASLLAMAAVMGSAGPGEAQEDPAAVARALIDAENRHDVDGAVALFAADAVVVDPSGRLTTTAEFRAWQTRLANGNFHATMATPAVAGDRVTFAGDVALDSLRALGFDKLDASWELTVSAGRVKAFTFAFTPEANARLQQAVAAQTLPRTGVDVTPLVELGVVALALGALALALPRRR